MQRGSTLLLKTVIIVLGLAVLALFTIAFPRVIGDISLGGYDPILLGMYLTAIPFYFALYQTMKLLSYIDSNTAFSEASVRALQNIKRSGLAISAMYAIGMPYIFHVANLDDAPGVVLIGCVFVGTSFVVAVFAAVLQKLLQNAIDIKSENELTV
jgi:hypothetical protein